MMAEFKHSSRRRTILVVLLVFTPWAICAWFFVRGSSEPKYQGKPVSYWFQQYCRSKGRHSFRAETALRQLGNKAVPFLLNQAMKPVRDTALRKNTYQFLEEFPESWGFPKYVSGEEMRRSAEALIGDIEPPADLLLPGLLKSLGQTNTHEYDWAISILARAGEGRETLVPYFATALNATNIGTRFNAAAFLCQLGSKAKPAIPELIHILQSADRTKADYIDSAFALGEMGKDGSPALPVLTEAYATETNWFLRYSWAAVLCMIEPKQTNALFLLSSSLTNQESSAAQVRCAAWRLGLVGQNAGGAIPALLRAADTTNTVVRRSVMDCLEKVGAPKDLIIPKLRARFTVEDQELRVGAATRVLEICPSDAEAQALLVNEVSNHTKFEWPSIVTLGLAGTNARPTAPQILEAFNGTNLLSWLQVPTALVKMGVPLELCMPQLKEKLGSGDDYVRARLAVGVLEANPSNELAVSVLMNLIERHSKQASLAIDALGDAGPAAAKALPLLRQQLGNKDVDVREAAADAIEQIKSNTSASPKHGQ